MDRAELQDLITEKSHRIVLKKGQGQSPVWEIFRFIILDGERIDYFVCCKRCLSVYKYSSATGTSGLNKHRVSCLRNSEVDQNLADSESDIEGEQILDPTKEQLISSVKIRPELYDGTEESVRTENIWCLIAEEVGKGVDWCKNVWLSLVANFVKQKKRTMQSGALPDSSWVYIEHLNFLEEHINHVENSISTATNLPVLSPNKSLTNKKKKKILKRPKQEVPEVEISLEENADNFLMMDDDYEETFDQTNSQIINHGSHSKQPKQSDNLQDPDLWAVNIQHQNSRKLDVHDLFCMSLAAQLRTLPPIYASKSRLKISEIMHSVEMEVQENGTR